MAVPNAKTREFTDRNGRAVHAFAIQMANLGFARMTDELLGMLDSGVWRYFKDGLSTYEFLPGEFDYFLTQWGVEREHVMRGIQDIDAKAKLESFMDERRTGEEGYRRRLVEVREANPQRPGNPIVPFGLTKAEAKYLVNGEGRGAPPSHRPALGERVRRYASTGGQTTKSARDELPTVERLRRSAVRLNDEDLAALVDALKLEQRQRRSI
jgi:hypothetical protein